MWIAVFSEVVTLALRASEAYKARDWSTAVKCCTSALFATPLIRDVVTAALNQALCTDCVDVRTAASEADALLAALMASADVDAVLSPDTDFVVLDSIPVIRRVDTRKGCVQLVDVKKLCAQTGFTPDEVGVIVASCVGGGVDVVAV